MSNKDNKDNKNIRIEFNPAFTMGPLVDTGIIAVRDREGSKVRVLCTDAKLNDKQEIVGIHPTMGVCTYGINGKFYNSGESEYDLHLEYDLELAKKKFGYDILGAVIMAVDVFGDPDQYSPAELKMIYYVCSAMMG